MIRAFGAVCILTGGVLLRQCRVNGLRRDLETMAQLLTALRQMGEEIRLTRTPLPRLLNRLGTGRSSRVQAFFCAAAAAASSGGDLSGCWRRGTAGLALPPAAEKALSGLADGLGGDEEQVCRAVSLVVIDLEHIMAQLQKEQADREKRTTALCLSGAALLVILLL